MRIAVVVVVVVGSVVVVVVVVVVLVVVAVGVVVVGPCCCGPWMLWSWSLSLLSCLGSCRVVQPLLLLGLPNHQCQALSNTHTQKRRPRKYFVYIGNNRGPQRGHAFP